MSYSHAMKILDMLVTAHEWLSNAMHEAATEVITQAQIKKKESGAMMLDGDDRFERYIRRAWAQAEASGNPHKKRNVVRMIADGFRYDVMNEGTARRVCSELHVPWADVLATPASTPMPGPPPPPRPRGR